MRTARGHLSSMRWEAVTALYAARQVKVASRTQLDAMLRLLERHRDPQFLSASRFVLRDLPQLICGPTP